MKLKAMANETEKEAITAGFKKAEDCPELK